ncbi:arylsulfatase [Pseudoroseomonas globiformis]|uniref:Arylsulfatase n=1 Tax=Teichococcus globiformis TaxID=2307229 RepID=A0ABV7G7P1_9PROT
MRIALIHALRHSPPPIEAAFARLWPDADLMNLLDTSLSADLARDGGITPAMTRRFLDLTAYALGTGADAVLFTCSAFGKCIDACKAAHPTIPILKPNEAMIEEAYAPDRRIGLLASFAPALESMRPEFPGDALLEPVWAEGALAALDRGDAVGHERAAVEAAARLQGCDVIALAQFSLAPTAQAIAASTGCPVLTTPDSAIRKLRAMVAA